jgi:hypothetical protein
MDGTSVVRRFPFALAKNLELYRPRLLVNLDVDLSAFTVALSFGPDKLRIREKFQRLSAPCAFDGLWDLKHPDHHGFVQCSCPQYGQSAYLKRIPDTHETATIIGQGYFKARHDPPS